MNWNKSGNPTFRVTGIFITGICLLALLFPNTGEAEIPVRCWVTFSDKGPQPSLRDPVSGSIQKFLTPRAIARRQKVLSRGGVTDDADFPLYQPYINAIVSLGGILCNESRWTNSASFLLNAEQRQRAGVLPFVRSVAPVAVFRLRPVENRIAPPAGSFTKPSSLDYGNSYRQLQTIGVPSLHEFGITGKKILVGMLDTGFRWRTHEALSTKTVVAEHDFIHNRNVTSDRPDDTPGQDSHGTLTLSVLGGFEPGQLIGPAYDAEYALAKTELIYPSRDFDTDSLREEDNWVAGIEWLEGLGADVVSSSLGYNTFVDAPGYSFAHGDFNGHTTHAALAALRAARLGVVVCTAMGNEGNGDDTTGTLLTPADADSIISVGAADYNGTLAAFSSTGPTNDGRIKPDVVAPGINVYGATTPGPSTYSYTNGTSLATPLTAGTAALLLSARPELGPMEVRDALRTTATPLPDPVWFPRSPNNFTGWGMINAFRAAVSIGILFSNEPMVQQIDSGNGISTFVLSNSGIIPGTVELSYAADDTGIFSSVPMALDSAMIYPTSGRYRAVLPRQDHGSIVQFFITAQDSAGRNYRSPHPGAQEFWKLQYGSAGLYDPAMHPAQYILHQNFPNPFNPGTTISYDLPRTDHTTISIYNVLGQLVSVLTDGMQEAGPHTVYFLGENLPSGVYFYRISTPSFSATRKMILLR